MKKSVLILPSWYATEKMPTNGSFFREQSLLVADDYDISIAVSEKFWISRQRFLFHKWFKRPFEFSKKPLAIQPPSGDTLFHPFCKYASDAENLAIQVDCFIRYLSQAKPALIHAHSSLTAGVLAHEISKKLQIPFIITEHTPFILSQFSGYWQTKIQDALECADKVLAVSEFQRQNMLMHGVACNPTVVGNLTDDENFVIPKQTAANEKVKLLIVTYYPNYIKDMDTFFEAMDLLKTKGYDQTLECIVVGGGEIHGEYSLNHYQKNIDQKKLGHFISVIPSASRKEMTALMQQTDALISSSMAESFGVAICEAMLCGKPVITTMNGGINDFADESNSIRVRIHDAQALAAGILAFIEKRHTFNPQTIRKSIVDKYGREAFKNRIKSIYDSVLAS